MNDNMPGNVREAMDYLLTGGFGEVVGFTDIALRNGQPKVQSDTDMMTAILILASESPRFTAGDDKEARDD